MRHLQQHEPQPHHQLCGIQGLRLLRGRCSGISSRSSTHAQPDAGAHAESRDEDYPLQQIHIPPQLQLGLRWQDVHGRFVEGMSGPRRFGLQRLRLEGPLHVPRHRLYVDGPRLPSSVNVNARRGVKK